MEKTEKNKAKDWARAVGKVWVRIPQTFKQRTTGSGIVFGGMYIDKKGGDKACQQYQKKRQLKT